MKQVYYSETQREKALIEFIADGKKFNFSPVVMKKYTSQLEEVQEEIQRDKDKRSKFKKLKGGKK